MATITRTKPSHLPTCLFKVIGGSTNDNVSNVPIHTNAAGSGYVDEVVIQVIFSTVTSLSLGTPMTVDIAAASTSVTIESVPFDAYTSRGIPYSGGTNIRYTDYPTFKVHLEENQLLRFDCANLTSPEAVYFSIYVNRIQNPA